MKNFLLLFFLTFVSQVQAANIGSATDNTVNVGGGNTTKRINWKGTPGYLKYDATAGRHVISNDGIVEKVLGSGGGGGSGVFSMMTNGGFEDGISSGWEFTATKVTPTNAANALQDLISAVFDPTAQNDYLRSIYFTVPKGIRGTACEARFKYIGGDAANYSAVVENQTGTVIGTYNRLGVNVLPLHTLPGYESIYYKCPTEADITAAANNGNVRVRVYQSTVTDAAAMTVDDVHFGSLIGLVETVLPDITRYQVSTLGVIDATKSVGDTLASCSKTTTGSYTCLFRAGAYSVAPTVNLSVFGSTNGDTKVGSAGSVVTTTGFSYTCNRITAAAEDCAAHITVSAAGVDAKQSVQVYKGVPQISANVNSFTATIDGAGTVLNEDVDFINGNCSLASTNQYSCSFISALATTTMTCAASPTAAITSARSSTTQTGGGAVSYSTWSGTTAAPMTATLTCNKLAASFSLPTVQPTVIGQVTNSGAESSLTNVRVESCDIANNGTASIGTITGLCGGWIQSVSRVSAGVISATFKTGIFSAPPNCSVIAETGNRIAYNLTTLSNTGITFTTVGTTFAGTDSDVAIMCQGKR